MFTYLKADKNLPYERNHKRNNNCVNFCWALKKL